MTLNKIKELVSKGLVTFLTASLISSIGWIVLQAVSVPELRAELRSELKHVNKNVNALNETAKETNVQLKAFTKHHGENLAIITKGIVTNTYRIDEVERKCSENHEHIRECEKYHLYEIK